MIKIGKLAKLIGVETHTVRFWEKSFPHIIPHLINGIRYYDDKGVEEFTKIKEMMYDKGMKIAGIQRMVKYGRISDKLQYETSDETHQAPSIDKDKILSKIDKALDIIAHLKPKHYKDSLF
jgi:DNA-binding transcriptional MerR regulator